MSAAAPQRSSSAAQERRFPSRETGRLQSSTRSPGATRDRTVSPSRPGSTRRSSSFCAFLPASSARCCGAYVREPGIFSFPHTTTGAPGRMRASTPPQFFTERKPFSSIEETVRPIWSRCASSSTCSSVSSGPKQAVTLPRESILTCPKGASSAVASSAALCSAPETPGAAHRRNRRSFSFCNAVSSFPFRRAIVRDV